jgi:hypothetical protein
VESLNATEDIDLRDEGFGLFVHISVVETVG